MTTLEDWRVAEDTERRSLAIRIEQATPNLRFIGLSASEDALPRYMHRECQVCFVWIPSHRFEFGLTPAEVVAAERVGSEPLCPAIMQRSTPSRRVQVDSFLIAERPILNREFSEGGLLEGRGAAPRSVNLTQIEMAEAFAARLGCRLPTEVEWEAASRGGVQTLFPFGDELLDRAELERWMLYDYEDTGPQANRFGVSGFFFGEVCLRSMPCGHSEDSRYESAYVGRGGGAGLWPWQYREWELCMCATRMTPDDLFGTGGVHFRLAMECY